MTNLNHNPLIAVQIHTAPSILWDVLQAPTKATATQLYQGHLPGSGVQIHSSDEAYRHGIVMECVESHNGRRLWIAKQGDRILAAHPKHNAARFMALVLATGA